MAISTFSIGGLQFVEPVLQGIFIDPWLARIEVVVGETGQPHSRHEPKYTRIIFDGVIEFRGWNEPIPTEREQHWKTSEPYRTEEIHDAGEADTSGEIEHVDEAFCRLVTAPPFRDPAKTTAGHRWRIRTAKPPRLAWLASWGCRIEFLYVGGVSHKELTTADELEEWRLQRVRLQRGGERHRKR